MKTLFRRQLIIPLIFCLLSNAYLSAQTTDILWKLEPGGNGWKNNFRYIIQTQDQNYIAAGTYSADDNPTDIWVVKFSGAGEIIWDKVYYTDTAQQWLEEGVYGIVERSDGEVVVFASTQEFNHYMLFMDSEGSLVRQVRHIASEDPYYVDCVSITEDDLFLVAGTHSIFLNNNWYHHSWYRKIDAEGNLIWEYSFPPVQWSDRFQCIQSLNDGGFILAGASDTPDNYDELLLARINAQGDTLWMKRWGTTAVDQPEEILPTPDGGYLIAATKWYNSYKGYLLKLDEAGNEEWMETYNDYDEDEIHAVCQTSDGGFILTGEYKPEYGAMPEFWMMKTDQQGQQVQAMTLGEEGVWFRGNCVIQDSDGGYIAAGNSSRNGIILKLNPAFGQFGIGEEDQPGLQIWPNPTHGQFKVQREKGKVEFQSLELIDICGMIVESHNNRTIEQWNSAAIDLDISHLPAGIYFIRISLENQTIVKKVIKL